MWPAVRWARDPEERLQRLTADLCWPGGRHTQQAESGSASWKQFNFQGLQGKASLPTGREQESGQLQSTVKEHKASLAAPRACSRIQSSQGGKPAPAPCSVLSPGRGPGRQRGCADDLRKAWPWVCISLSCAGSCAGDSGSWPSAGQSRRLSGGTGRLSVQTQRGERCGPLARPCRPRAKDSSFWSLSVAR